MAGKKAKKISKKQIRYLNNIYYKPASGASFSSANTLLKEVERRGNKHKFTLNIIKQYLNMQRSHLLQKMSQSSFLRASYDALFQGYLIQFDLSYMKKYEKVNEDKKYILGVIDTLSKYAAVRVLENRDDDTVSQAMDDILSNLPFKVMYALSDLGSEFKGDEFKAVMTRHGIKHYTTYTSSAWVVERFFKTLKKKIQRYMIQKNTQKYIDVIQKIVESYNATPHSSLDNLRPIDINRSNQFKVYRFQEAKSMKKYKKRPFKYNIGDTVLISISKSIYDKKEMLLRWKPQVYTVYYRYKSKNGVNLYKLIYCDKKMLVGTFYEAEMSKIDPYKFYVIESVLKSERNRKQVTFQDQADCKKWITNKEYNRLKFNK